MAIRCNIRGCKTVGTSGFHSFPTDAVTAKKWIEATDSVKKSYDMLMERLRTKNLARSFFKICNKHFKDSDYETMNGERHLMKGSLPALMLPDSLRIQREHDYSSAHNQVKKEGKFIETRAMVVNDQRDSVNNSDVAKSSMAVVQSCARLNFIGGNAITSQQRLEKVREKAERARREASLRYYKKKCERQAVRLKAMKWNDDNAIKYLSGRLNKQALEFTKMQIHNCDKKPNGRRYNSDQKNFSLALYKQGAKSYRFMHRSFVLPVKSTLTTHSAHLVIQPGIDPTLMKFITNKVKDFALTDKYCMVTWDEVALRPHLDYSPSRDIIDGFVDIEIRHPLFATHALTFMVRGINVRYKQPVAHFYTCNITGVELALLIRRVTEAVLDTGLLVIGSLSDQVNINVSAVNILVNPNNPKTKPNGEIIKYRIRDVVIVHCWDPPHLIKVVRNNILVKDLTHYVDQRWTISDTKIDTCVKKIPVQCASWSHIEELYQSDILSTHRMLENLSDEHIKPVKKKMKVYGIETLLTIGNLERAGLLKVQSGTRSYGILRKILNLTVDDALEVDPKDISYVHSFYAPLTIRIVEQSLKPLGWQALNDNIGCLPGPAFEDFQSASHNISNRRGSLTSEMSQSDQPKVILVFFLGGCTFAEIAALRFLSKQEDTNVEFVIATTKIINKNAFLDMFLENGKADIVW